jgi:hypothetical protein
VGDVEGVGGLPTVEVRAASVGSRFTARCLDESWSYLRSTGLSRMSCGLDVDGRVMSRSWITPQTAHVHDRTNSGFGPSLTPHAEHTCDVGSNRPIFTNVRPYRRAL